MVRQLAGGLARVGVETHVATTDDNASTTLDVPHGVPVGEDGITYWYFPRQLRFYTVSWPLAAWLARHVTDFDVVHIHALFSFATLPAAYWSHRLHVPYIVRPLGTLNTWGMSHRRPWLKNASFHLIESRVVKHAALVHYTSEDERQQAEALGVTTASVVIPNAIADEEPAAGEGGLRRRLGPLGQRKIVLFLSRIDEKKGLDLLLNAHNLVRVRVPDALLVITGNGSAEYVARLEEQMRALGLGEDEVVWTGFLSGREKAAALADANVYVLPSYSENFGIAVAEAMAAGLPVVVSDQVGIHKQVADAGAGLVVPCEAAQLADAIETLLTNREMAAAMGRRGAALVRRRYSSEAVTTQIIDAYNSVAGHTVPERPERRVLAS